MTKKNCSFAIIKNIGKDGFWNNISGIQLTEEWFEKSEYKYAK